MLDPLGKVDVRMTTHTDGYQTTGSRDLAIHKAEKIVEKRPLDNVKESATIESSAVQKTDGYNLDGGGIFYEKYDKNGNVIIRVPEKKSLSTILPKVQESCL
jgi:hypothetical protein